MYVEEFIFSSQRPNINSSWYLKKCGGCGRVEELSELFKVLRQEMMIEILKSYILDCELILAELRWMIVWHGQIS